MSKHHNAQQREAILQLLDKNLGDIALTSAQAGIAERTLYAWRHKREILQQSPQFQPQEILQTIPKLQQQQSEEDQLNTLRESMMQTALAIAQSLHNNIESRSLNVRVKALTNLLDRVQKLDEQYGSDDSENGVQTIQIEYVDVDGKVYAAPPWATDDGDEDESEDSEADDDE